MIGHFDFHCLLVFCVCMCRSDVNECETLSRACVNGQCVNNQGSYRCECHFGFTLAKDGRTCLGELHNIHLVFVYITSLIN